MYSWDDYVRSQRSFRATNQLWLFAFASTLFISVALSVAPNEWSAYLLSSPIFPDWRLKAWYSEILAKHFQNWQVRTVLALLFIYLSPIYTLAGYSFGTYIRPYRNKRGFFRTLVRISAGLLIVLLIIGPLLFLPGLDSVKSHGIFARYPPLTGIAQGIGFITIGMIINLVVQDIQSIFWKSETPN